MRIRPRVEAMTNGAGHMKLDERAHEAAALALNERANKKYNFYYVAKTESLDLSEVAITAFLSSTVPGDVRELAAEMNAQADEDKDKADWGKLPPGEDTERLFHDSTYLLRDGAARLLTYIENTKSNGLNPVSVCAGKLTFRLLDGLRINCCDIAEPYASQIVEAIDAAIGNKK